MAICATKKAIFIFPYTTTTRMKPAILTSENMRIAAAPGTKKVDLYMLTYMFDYHYARLLGLFSKLRNVN